MASALKLGNISTKLLQIAELAKHKLKGPITSLNHHLDMDWMREAWRGTRKNGASGVDRVTADEYAVNLDNNLEDLLNRAKSGSYKAPPSRRVYIPKGGGEKRGIAVPCLADKVLQRAVVNVLNPIYEHDFHDSSYGFRPGRNCHQALETLKQSMWKMGGGYIIEADIQKFFDNIDRKHLRSFIEERIKDGVILKLINKWLKAGILEGENIHRPEKGSVQGGVISPLLANIYLHYVLDQWFEETVKSHLQGKTFLVRFCDDFVIGVTNESDANRVVKALHGRFEKYGLKLHPKKTRIIPFQKPYRSETKRDKSRSQSFDFLGFSICWIRSQKGRWYIGMVTARDRMTRGLKEINQWARRNRHLPVKAQVKVLASKIRGHKNYYRRPGNTRKVDCFQYFALKIWRKWLNRRSNKGTYRLERLCQLLKRHGKLLRI